MTFEVVISFRFGIDREYHPYVTVNEFKPPVFCLLSVLVFSMRDSSTNL